MPRRRLGVALLLPQAVALEVDGLRRACGDPALGRIPPHLTLVPPVNVREDDVPEAIRTARAAAASVREPLELELGPVGSFLPDTPVLRLDVGGRDAALVPPLRERLLTGPLDKRSSWPFVPHVTLADGIAEDRVVAAVQALGSWTAPVRIGSLHVLQQEADRTWVPIAEARFGRGRASSGAPSPVEVGVTEVADADAVARLGPRRWAVTARVGGRPVGLVLVLEVGDAAHVVWLVVDEAHRRIGIGRRMLGVVEHEARRRDLLRVTSGDAGLPSEVRATLTDLGFVPDGGALERRLG